MATSPSGAGFVESRRSIYDAAILDGTEKKPLPDASLPRLRVSA
jgi:hypothetical protein